MAVAAGDLASRASLLSVYGMFRGMSDGEVMQFVELERQAIALAEEAGNRDLYLIVAPTVTYALYLIGEYREGVMILDRALEKAGGDPSVGAGVVLGCPMAFCLIFKGGYLAHLGQLETGSQLIAEGRELAASVGDMETVGFSHMWEVWFEFFAGDAVRALEHGEQALAIANRIGDARSQSVSSWLLGWARLMNDDFAGAIEAVEHSLAIARERRVAVDSDAMSLALLAQAHAGAGEGERARQLVARALVVAEAQGHRLNEAFASLARAKVLLRSRSTAAFADVEAALARVSHYAESSGARAFLPLIHLERADLARCRGDETARTRELGEARRLFEALGANGHLRRLEAALERDEPGGVVQA
jgi:tetratricopeptide (TPR) repeat protein